MSKLIQFSTVVFFSIFLVIPAVEAMRDVDGNLFDAVMNGRLDCIELHLQQGANINAHYDYPENNGNDMRTNDTPLHMAIDVYGEDTRMSQFLIERGADVNRATCNGYTPLHRAALGKNFAILTQLLIHHGARVNAQSQYGETPLHCAARSGESVDVARVLLENGADIDAQDSQGDTALHNACGMHDGQMKQYLLDQGANRELVNDLDAKPAIDFIGCFFSDDSDLD